MLALKNENVGYCQSDFSILRIDSFLASAILPGEKTIQHTLEKAKPQRRFTHLPTGGLRVMGLYAYDFSISHSGPVFSQNGNW